MLFPADPLDYTAKCPKADDYIFEFRLEYILIHDPEISSQAAEYFHFHSAVNHTCQSMKSTYRKICNQDLISLICQVGCMLEPPRGSQLSNSCLKH